MQRMQKLKQTNAISQEDFKVAEQNLAAAKAKLAEIEAEMPYFLGQQHGHLVSSVTFSPDGKLVVLPATNGAVKFIEIDPSSIQPFETRGVKNVPTREGGTVTEKLLKALDTPMTVDYQDKPIDEIFKEMEKRVPGLSIQVQIPASDEDDFRRLTLKGQFSMRAVLALMEDTFSFLRINLETQTHIIFTVRSFVRNYYTLLPIIFEDS